jgi:hypothetical protein
MAIYKKRTPSRIYRKIYEQHHGPIPRELNGRSFEIHHIDGDSNNNDPSNLVALSIQEHYDVHYAQGDLGACYKIGIKMSMSPEELSNLAKKHAAKRVENGTHNLLREFNPIIERTKNGLNPLSKRPDGTSVCSDWYASGGVSTFAELVGDKHPSFDHNIYAFKHKKTGEVVNMTKFQLRITYNLNKGNVYEMVNGNRQSCGGWSLLKTE